MNYKQLEALIYVARHGTFKKAAESLYFELSGEDYVTPESIQYRLKQLEQDLGVSLYQKRRGSSRVQLTREGQLFLSEAVDVYQRMSEWQTRFLDEGEGMLTIASTQAVIIHRLLPAIKKFREQNPQTVIRALNLDDENTEKAVFEGRVDLAFSVRPPDSESLEYVLWKRSHLVVVLPLGHKLGRRDEVELKDLVEDNLIVLNPDIRGDRDMLNRSFMDSGCAKPNIAIETSNSEMITAMVEAGLGLGIMSNTSMANQSRQVTSVPIKDLNYKSEVGLLVRRGQFIGWRARSFLTELDPIFEQWLQSRELPEGEEQPEQEELETLLSKNGNAKKTAKK